MAHVIQLARLAMETMLMIVIHALKAFICQMMIIVFHVTLHAKHAQDLLRLNAQIAIQTISWNQQLIDVVINLVKLAMVLIINIVFHVSLQTSFMTIVA